MPTCERCHQNHDSDGDVSILCHLYSSYDLRRMCDSDLLTFRAYHAREVAEGANDRDSWRYACLDAELDRRRNIALRGGPAVNGNALSLETIAQIKARFTEKDFIDLFARITGYDVFPARQKDRWHYRCTAHGDDKEASGILYLDQLRFHCFGCNSGGDLFSLLQSAPLNLTFREAVEYAAQMVGIELVTPRTAFNGPVE